MKHLSLRAKLFCLAIFLQVISLAIGISSYRSSNKVQNAFGKVVSSDVPSLRAVNRMLLAFRMARIELQQAANPDASEEIRAESLKGIEEQWADFEKNDKMYVGDGLEADEKEIYNEFKGSVALSRADFDKAVEVIKTHPTAGSEAQRSLSHIILVDLSGHGVTLRAATQKLIGYQSKQIELDTQEATSSAKAGLMLNLIVLLGGLVSGGVFTFVFTRRLSGTLSSISETISQATTQVSAASHQIASAAEELSQAATEQAASLQETSASIEEISATVNKNADSARESNRISTESQDLMVRGKSAVADMMESIQEIDRSNSEISAQIETSNREISEIVKVIAEIGNKTKVINDIVFQTKLLSFNASVEAARAGEHGKGFAVVAEEVGNLAQMSGNAAKEITTMLDGSIQKVEQIVGSTRTQVEALVASGKHKVEKGNEVARRCGEVFGQISQSVTEVGTRVSEIAAASTEQAQGVREVNTAIAQMDQVTQQNASVSQQSASAASELSAQAESLARTVAELMQTVRGGHPASGVHDQRASSVVEITPRAAATSSRAA